MIQTEVPAPVLPPVGGKKCFQGLKWNPLHGGESGLRRICSDTAYCLQLNLILLPFCLPEKSKRLEELTRGCEKQDVTSPGDGPLG